MEVKKIRKDKKMKKKLQRLNPATKEFMHATIAVKKK